MTFLLEALSCVCWLAYAMAVGFAAAWLMGCEARIHAETRSEEIPPLNAVSLPDSGSSEIRIVHEDGGLTISRDNRIIGFVRFENDKAYCSGDYDEAMNRLRDALAERRWEPMP